MTDINSLKENFNTQIKSTNEQIIDFEEQLNKLKEYKLKLLGGLETLELLEQQNKVEETSDQPVE